MLIILFLCFNYIEELINVFEICNMVHYLYTNMAVLLKIGPNLFSKSCLEAPLG
jgi:hypothetical protein